MGEYGNRDAGQAGIEADGDTAAGRIVRAIGAMGPADCVCELR
jgi:hypothetical protein